MARAARDGRAQAPRPGRLTRPSAWLAAAAALACASQQDPPGGPPDFMPPDLVLVVPDSGSALTDLDRRVRFAFDEVIAERGLADLVTVSPRHERVAVRWERDAVTVRPDGGWRPDVVYTVVLGPGLLDLRNNRRTTGATTVFSTGGGFPAGAVRGVLVDWEAGRRAVGALVEAIRPADSLTYVTRSDSSGTFLLPWLGAGPWTVVATVDQDRNGRRGRREAFDTALVSLGAADTAALILWTFVHDSAGPALREAQRADSLTVRLTFAGRLAPVAPGSDQVRAFLLPDTVPLAVDTVWTEAAWQAARAAAPPDSATAPPDSTAGPPIAVAPADTAAGAGAAAAPDTVLAMRPPLSSVWFVRLAAPLVPGGRYLFEAAATGPSGATDTSRTVLAVPEPPPGDSTEVR